MQYVVREKIILQNLKVCQKYLPEELSKALNIWKIMKEGSNSVLYYLQRKKIKKIYIKTNAG